MNKIGYLLIGAILSPILLWSIEIIIFIIGLLTISIVGSIFADEMKKIETEE